MEGVEFVTSSLGIDFGTLITYRNIEITWNLYNNEKLCFHTKIELWGKKELLSITEVNLWFYELIYPPHVPSDLFIQLKWPWWQTLRPSETKP